MKTVLAIQSQVASARVGNSVAVFALERLGVDVIPLPTTLYGRRPDRGPPGGGPVPAELLTAMLSALEAEGRLARVDAVLSGYIAAGEQADFIADAVKRVKAANPAAIYVCDPVMGDADGGRYVSEEAADAITRRLVPLADLITPNLWELSTLVGWKALDLPSAIRAAKVLGKAALITSAPSSTGIGTLYCGGDAAWLSETPLIPNPPKGAGDLIAALFLGQRLRGESIAVALEASAGATYDVIVRSFDNGGDLAVIEAQDRLVEPQTWPTAQKVG